MTLRVDVNLYGSIAHYFGGKHVAWVQLELEEGASKADLLENLGIPPEERGYLFINAVLYDVPGLVTDNHDKLEDGDHIGIFAVDRIWPYQYRDGINMSAGLKAALEQHGPMHHSYKDAAEET